MPLTVDDFITPAFHPFGMLQGYNHNTMVNDGLLIKLPDNHYKLTTKSIGLLYSIYAKENKSEHSRHDRTQ